MTEKNRFLQQAGRMAAMGSTGGHVFPDRLGLLRRLRLTLLKPLTRRGQDSATCYMVNKALGRVCHNSAAGAL